MTTGFLNSRQMREIAAAAKQQWGSDALQSCAMLRKGDDIFIVSRSIEAVPLDALRVNALGLYIGEFRNSALRLSMEGAQLIGPSATKNVVDVSLLQRDAWLRGSDIETVTAATGFVILRCGKDFLGCGAVKNGKILNFIPKARRITSAD